MRLSGLSLFLLVSLGCSRTPQEPEGHDTPPSALHAPSSGASSLPAPVVPGTAPATAPQAAGHDIVWNDPAGWQRTTPSSSMRKASYKVHRLPKDSEDVEVAVFYFGGEGGGTGRVLWGCWA